LIPLRDDNPSSITPVVSWVLIATCGLAFLWQLSLGPREGQVAVYALGVIPAILFEGARLPPEVVVMVPPAATVFTSMFLHGGWMHLLGNMLYLWIFGKNVEDAMGPGRFLLFYLLTGLCATFVHVLSEPDSAIPMIGASGAIAGVLGAYFILYPRAQIKTFILLIIFIQIIHIPAVFILGFWFIRQILGIGSDGVAWYAHIGGFLVGMFLIRKFLQRSPARIRVDARREW